MKIWVFIWRLNPPHLGHLNTIEKSLKQDDKTIVILWSANIIDENNYFRVEDRKEMLKLNFPNNSFIIEEIEDVESDREWVKYIKNIIFNSAWKISEISFYGWDFENDSAIKALKQYEEELWWKKINYIEYSRKNMCFDHNGEVCYYSSTLVRKSIKNNDMKLLEKLLSKGVFKSLINKYEK